MIMAFLAPVLIFVGILFLCKRFNFSVLPDDFRGKEPEPFKTFRIKRNGYEWNIE